MKSFTMNKDTLKPAQSPGELARDESGRLYSVRMRELFDPLEVVDQAGDVAWRGIEVHREVPEGGGPAAMEAEQHAQAPLAEVVLLSPALVQLRKRV